jgi:hypothetical protein
VSFYGSSETAIRSDFVGGSVPVPEAVLETRVTTWLRD